MTCIVGIADGENVWVGGDGVGWIDSTPFPHDNGKVFPLGEMIFGICGDRRFAELVRFAFSLPPISRSTPEGPRAHIPRKDVSGLDKYMATDFSRGLREACREHGYLRSNDGRECLQEGDSLLVGVRGRLYYASSAFSVSGIRGGYYAIGCGRKYALGALAVTPALKPEERISAALGAAELWDDGVRAPFHVLDALGQEEAHVIATT